MTTNANGHDPPFTPPPGVKRFSARRVIASQQGREAANDPLLTPAWRQTNREWHERRRTEQPRIIRAPTPSAAADDELGSAKLAGVDPKPVEWVWPGRIAIGKLTLLAGDPGLGKSQIATYIAARITDAGDWADCGQAALGNVAILSAEDDLADKCGRCRLTLTFREGSWM